MFPSQHLNYLTDFYEIWYEYCAIQGCVSPPNFYCSVIFSNKADGTTCEVEEVVPFNVRQILGKYVIFVCENLIKQEADDDFRLILSSRCKNCRITSRIYLNNKW
jgi:hypothetical protein